MRIEHDDTDYGPRQSYVVEPSSLGANTHPCSRPYTLLIPSFSSRPMVTVDFRNLVLHVALLSSEHGPKVVSLVTVP